MASDERPSVFLGLRSAWRLRSIVAAVWIVGHAVVVPITWVFGRAAADGLTRIPDGFSAGDDRILLLFGALGNAAEGITVGLILAVVASWVWTVLWHGGVARASVWDRGGSPSLSRILGLGLGVWWRYLRLSVFALVAFSALMALVWIPVGSAAARAHGAMAEGRMVGWIAVGLLLSPLVKILVWVGTLRGAWELARPDARSGIAAWIRGLVGGLKTPVASVIPVLVLGFGQGLLAIGQIAIPWWIPALRGTPLGLVFVAVSSLGASFLLVALFCAYEPVGGMLVEEE